MATVGTDASRLPRLSVIFKLATQEDENVCYDRHITGLTSFQRNLLFDAELDFSAEESERNIKYNAQGKLMAATLSMIIKKLTSPDASGIASFIQY